VDAAVVELDALSDAVRAGADDHHPRPSALGRPLLALTPGRVGVARARLDLARARVDTAKHRNDALLQPPPPDLDGGDFQLAGDRLVTPAGPLGGEEIARAERLDRALELLPEPRMHGLGELERPGPRRRGAGLELARAERLEVRLRERPADAHRLADRLHLGAERVVGSRELLEGEARELDDDVVQRRLEARRRRLRQVVRDLVQRVPDGELGRDLRDRVAGRLRGERRRAGDAGVHLDHAHLARLAIPGELDVRAARLHSDGADDRGCGVAELLVGLVGERHLRCDGDRVSRVDAHGVQVLDRADDHDVVHPVTDHLELELVPTPHRLLDEDLADRGLREPSLHLRVQRRTVLREAAPVPSERERGPDDRR